MRRALAPLFLLASLGASVARAEAISVLGVEAVGVPDAQAQALTTSLREGLKRRPNLQQMPGKDFVEMRFLFGCTDEATLGPCMVQAGRTLVADRLVLATMTGGTAKDGGTVAVQLRLLDVASGKFVREVRESVAASALAPGAIDARAERWLAQLLGDAVTGPPEAPVREAGPVDKERSAAAPASPGRALVITGAVALAVAAIAAGAAVVTWRHYLGLQDDAATTLGAVRDANPGYYAAHTDFFAKPGCSLPGSMTPLGPVAAYQRQCSDGQTWAAATTGLWVGAGVLAAGGVTALVLGARQKGRGERSASSLSERLVVAPTLSPGGGGLALGYTF